jgi:hypothetical protein
VKRHAIALEGLHERASATPDRAERRDAPTHAGPPAAAHAVPVPAGALDTSLRGRQLWFARAVMAPESEPSPSPGEVAAMLTVGPRLGAADRLAIYRRGYHSRLVECLADDYPVLQHALGAEAFESLCHAYIAEHPSRGPNLNFFSRFMAEWIRSGAAPGLAARELAADLAALEWAIVEVIHAPSSEPLTLEGLGQVPPDAWSTARLRANTAVRLLSFGFPVNTYFQAFRDDEDPSLPGPAPSATVVYRSGPTVWRMDLTEPMFAVLSALLGGEGLEASLERAAPGLAHVDEQEAAERVTSWFREWVGSGLFTGLEIAP